MQLFDCTVGMALVCYNMTENSRERNGEKIDSLVVFLKNQSNNNVYIYTQSTTPDSPSEFGSIINDNTMASNSEKPICK